MNYCQYIVVECECSRGFKEPDCNEQLCGEPAVMKYRGKWYCLRHGEMKEALWEGNRKEKDL